MWPMPSQYRTSHSSLVARQNNALSQYRTLHSQRIARPHHALSQYRTARRPYLKRMGPGAYMRDLVAAYPVSVPDMA
eukprot:3445048-Rhodomonas_salina.2